MNLANVNQVSGSQRVVYKDECYTFKNYDLKSLASDSIGGLGHTDYAKNLKLILEFIKH